jgi:DNA adenine methylase
MGKLAQKHLRRVVAARRAVRPAAPAQPGPIVKWAGGKTKLLEELGVRAPVRFRRYFEPFCGGGALFFRLAPKAAVLNDSNPDLMNAYRCVAWNVEAVIRKLGGYRERHCESAYYEVRERWNDGGRPMGEVERAAAFLYLNKTCYNGLWRVNASGRFNVPVGRYTDPQIFDPEVLRASSRVLQRADLRTGNYADAVEAAEAGDFVYFDPPYQPLSATASFTSYTAADFGEDDQHELAAIARGLSARGCAVMISNSDTPFIRRLYTGFRIDTVECARAINSKATRRGKVNEVVITNET